VSLQPSAQLADWNNVRQSLAQICASYDESDSFFSGMFDRVEELAQELVRKQRAWASQHEQSKSELGREKAELAEAQRQVQIERERLEKSEPAAGDAVADQRLAAEVQRLEKERDQLYHQQQLLAAELDTVRGRAAEMAERLVQQQTELAAERAQWTEELKRMRHVIETFAHQQAAQLAAAPPQPRSAETPATVRASQAPTTPPADPVLGSVMAQFEMLQRDVAERRKKLAGAN
jgi:chromosome segregation ATPase